MRKLPKAETITANTLLRGLMELPWGTALFTARTHDLNRRS